MVVVRIKLDITWHIASSYYNCSNRRHYFRRKLFKALRIYCREVLLMSFYIQKKVMKFLEMCCPNGSISSKFHFSHNQLSILRWILIEIIIKKNLATRMYIAKQNVLLLK